VYPFGDIRRAALVEATTMLTQTELTSLLRSLTGERVLTVYLDGTAVDPAVQRAWRVQLDHSLADLRTWLADSARDDRTAFERCVELLQGQLAGFEPGVGSPGWAAFITPKRVHEAHHLPVPTPTLAVWSTGPCLAPYIRALKEDRPVVVAVVDARQAELYRYRLGTPERVETMHAHHVVQETAHMGTSPRQGYHVGTRGSTGRDAAQRSLLAGRNRMITQSAARILELAGTDGWIVLGGIRRVVASLAPELEARAPGRVLTLPTLDVHASTDDVAHAARTGASTLRSTHDAGRIAAIADLAAAHGLGVTGSLDTKWALEQSAVRELFLTHRFLEDHGADAEDAVRAALEQDATVEEVSGDAAGDLDAAGGIAAALRFRPAPSAMFAG
jgi:release factor family 10